MIIYECDSIGLAARLNPLGGTSKNGRPGGVDVGHQLMGLLIAAVGVVALGQRKIGDRELLGGDRPDVDPEPLEQRHSIIRKQLSPSPQSEGAFHRNSGRNVKINQH
jgi:hypothetical protein